MKENQETLVEQTQQSVGEELQTEQNQELIKKQRKQRRGNILFFTFVGIFVLIIIGNIFLFTKVLFQVSVEGNSMKSTLSHGDVLIVNRYADVDRGDIVIIKKHKNAYTQEIKPVDGKVDLTKLHYPCLKVVEVKNQYGQLTYTIEGNILTINNPRHEIEIVYETEYSVVKRVIGIEGDTIKLERGKVYLKTSGQTDFQVLEEDYLDEWIETNAVEGYPKEWTCGKGEIFYLGDNRIDSEDSRVDGCCKVENVEGVVSKFAIWIKPITTFIGKLFS